MKNVELRKEWGKRGKNKAQIEHEMAMRFMDSQAVPLRYMNKWLDLPDQFMEAYHSGKWYRAKYIYDMAIVVGAFLDVPDLLYRQAFGISDPDEPEIQGMFPRDVVSRVYEECVVRDNLGHECVVYRVPGEIGFYGARQRPGTRIMSPDKKRRSP